MMHNVTDFIDSLSSLMLSSIDQEALPHASVAPFVLSRNRFYIYISDLAKHAQNLKYNSKCALLFTEDEGACENIFARKRIMIQADAQPVLRGSETFNGVMDAFAVRFDKALVNTLRSMLDFNLFVLEPVKGEAVFGFGQAYTFEGGDFNTLKQKDATGHIKS